MAYNKDLDKESVSGSEIIVALELGNAAILQSASLSDEELLKAVKRGLEYFGSIRVIAHGEMLEFDI